MPPPTTGSAPAPRAAPDACPRLHGRDQYVSKPAGPHRRWHNKRFAKLAAELGMTTTKDPKLGYSPCTLTDATTATYQAVITDLGNALNVWRHPELIGEANGRTNNNNGVTTECACPRK